MAEPGDEYAVMATDAVGAELAFRLGKWQQLHRHGGPHDVPKSLIRELKMYGGAQGVWVDAERTRGLAPEGGTVGVGLLHTGRHYADDLSPSGDHLPLPQDGSRRRA
jgi:hypothetical protein